MTENGAPVREKSASTNPAACPLCAPRWNSRSPLSRARQSAFRGHALLVLEVPKQGQQSPSPEHSARFGEMIQGLSESAAKFGIVMSYARRNGRGRLADSTPGPGAGPGARIEIDKNPGSVPKYRFAGDSDDAFSNEELLDVLRKHRVGHIFLAGLDGATAIRQTALSALDRGYRVTFIRDGISTAFASRWERLLKDFEANAVFAIGSEEYADLATALHDTGELPEVQEPQEQQAVATSDDGPGDAGRSSNAKSSGIAGLHRSAGRAVAASRALLAAWHEHVRRRPLRQLAGLAVALAAGGLLGWSFNRHPPPAAEGMNTGLAEVKPDGDKVAVDRAGQRELELQMGLREARHAADDAAEKLRQEREKIDEVTRDLATARSHIEAQNAIAKQADSEWSQAKEAAERAAAAANDALHDEEIRAGALARDLDSARRKIESLAASAKTASEASEQVRAEATQKLQLERERTESLARDLAATRRELEKSAAESTLPVENAAEQPPATQAPQPTPQAEPTIAGTTSMPNEPFRAVAPKDAVTTPSKAVAPAAPVTAGAPVTDETERLMTRARALIKQGDIGAARTVLDRAVETGSALALYALAETYDPAVLSAWGTFGTQGDVVTARELYTRALAGGVPMARDRLNALRP